MRGTDRIQSYHRDSVMQSSPQHTSNDGVEATSSLHVNHPVAWSLSCGWCWFRWIALHSSDLFVSGWCGVCSSHRAFIVMVDASLSKPLHPLSFLVIVQFALVEWRWNHAATIRGIQFLQIVEWFTKKRLHKIDRTGECDRHSIADCKDVHLHARGPPFHLPERHEVQP